MCDIRSSIYSENNNESKYLGINFAVINGISTIGMYFYILKLTKYYYFIYTL